VVFLEQLSSYEALPSTHIFHLDELYKVSKTPNAEIRLRFYELALKDPVAPAAKHFAFKAAAWVVGTDGSGVVKGRMKFCRPIFKGVFKVDKALAVDTFSNSKEFFHPIARKQIEKVCSCQRSHIILISNSNSRILG